MSTTLSRHTFSAANRVAFHSVSKRAYKLYPTAYTLDDYFKAAPPESLDSGKLVEATLMSDEAKPAWVAAASSQEAEKPILASWFLR